MTPVARGVLAFVLVAGAGPAGFLIYHTVFDSHPLHHAQDSSTPQALGSGPAPHSAPASGPGAAPVLPQTTSPGAADPTIPPTQTTSTHGPTPLTLPDTVVLPDSNGKMHHLAEYRGHPLVLNFWATWCEPCQREIPLLESLHQERRDSVQIVGVAVDFQADVLKFAQAHGITYPLLMGEKNGLAAVNAFGMETAFPFTVFADSRGRIVTVKLGELHADEARLILGEITAIDAGKIGLADARDAISTGLRSLAIARAQQSSTAAAAAGAKS